MPETQIPPSSHDVNQGAGQEKRMLVDGLRYAHLGFVLPIAVIAGWYFGVLLDKWLGTHWLYLAGLGFGIVAGFYDLIRTVAKMGKGV